MAALTSFAAPRALACGKPEPVGLTGTGAQWQKLVDAARAQIGVTTVYDPAYVRLPFPGGDVPRDRGVCTDVVIRAYRDAFGIDLQKRVHDDMKRNFAAYPTRWGLKKPDRNIDHRRVPNLQTFFSRQGGGLPVPETFGGFQPGELVTMLVANRLPHIGIVSDSRTPDGTRPLVIHNIGAGTREEDILTAFTIDGRFKYAST
jgi:uncharacterized protein YijF (DUF1287 family)